MIPATLPWELPEPPPLARPPAWTERAACREVDPDLWFPERGDAEARKAAVRICATCPVVEPCREAGAGQLGIWGGQTERERGVQVGWRYVPCGTTVGYRAHLRRGEQACGPCCAANAAVSRQRYSVARHSVPCGTRAGAERHRRAGEDPCPTCLAAEREYNRRAKRRSRLMSRAAS